MSMPAYGDVTTITVTGQMERDEVQPAGPPIKGVLVFYTTGKGNNGSLWLPRSTYNQGPDVVTPLLVAAGARMDAIGAINTAG